MTMIMPIQPLPPISTLPPATTMPPVTGATGAAPVPSTELVDLFRTKLDAARLAPPDASRAHGPSALTEAITREDQAFKQLSGEMDRFAVEAPQMSQQELVAAAVKLQGDAAQMMCKMHAGQMVAQGIKSSVQTLMKNQ